MRRPRRRERRCTGRRRAAKRKFRRTGLPARQQPWAVSRDPGGYRIGATGVTSAQQLGREIEEKVNRAVVLPRTIPKKIDGTVLWPRQIASKEMSRHCVRAQSRSRKCPAVVAVHTRVQRHFLPVYPCTPGRSRTCGPLCRCTMGGNRNGPAVCRCEVVGNRNATAVCRCALGENRNVPAVCRCTMAGNRNATALCRCTMAGNRNPPALCPCTPGARRNGSGLCSASLPRRPHCPRLAAASTCLLLESLRRWRHVPGGLGEPKPAGCDRVSAGGGRK